MNKLEMIREALIKLRSFAMLWDCDYLEECNLGTADPCPRCQSIYTADNALSAIDTLEQEPCEDARIVALNWTEERSPTMTEPNERDEALYQAILHDEYVDARSIADYRLELTAERDKTIERLELEIEQHKNVDRLRVEQLRMQMFEVHDSRAEVERLRTAATEAVKAYDSHPSGIIDHDEVLAWAQTIMTKAIGNLRVVLREALASVPKV
jgi:hypothetical protein